MSERVSSPEWIVSPAKHLGLASFAAVLVGQEQHNRAAFCSDRCNMHKFQGTLVCECEGYSGFALGAGMHPDVGAEHLNSRHLAMKAPSLL